MIKRAIFLCFIVLFLSSCNNQGEQVEKTIPTSPLCTDQEIAFCAEYLDFIQFIENAQTFDQYTLELPHETHAEFFYKDGTKYLDEYVHFGPIFAVEEFDDYQEIYQYQEDFILPVLKQRVDKKELSHIALNVKNILTAFNAIYFLDLTYVSYIEEHRSIVFDVETYMKDFLEKYHFIPSSISNLREFISVAYTFDQDNKLHIERTSKDYIHYAIFTPHQSKQIIMPNDYAVFVEKDEYSYYIYHDEVYLKHYFTDLSYVLIPSVIDNMTVVGFYLATIYGDAVTTVEIPDTIRYFGGLLTNKIFINFKLVIPQDHTFERFISHGNFMMEYLYIPDDDTKVYQVHQVMFPVLLERMYNPDGNDDSLSSVGVAFDIKEVVEQDNFIFAITKNNQTYIVKYKGSLKDIIIPAAYQTYPVIGMFKNALVGYTFDSVKFASGFSMDGVYQIHLNGLTTKNFYLPETITVIGRYDFEGVQITNLFLGQHVTYVERYAFENGIDYVHVSHSSIPSGFQTYWDEGVIVVFAD